MANGDHKSTTHHVIPKSKAKAGENVVTRIPYREHNLWHALYANMRPEEAIRFTVETFFGGDWGYVELALHQKFEKEGL
jgi:hypothetical protein